MLVRSEVFSLIGMEDEDQPQPESSGGGAATRPAAVRGTRLPALSHLPELVARMAQGRQDALSTLYDDTSSMLNGLLHRILEHRPPIMFVPPIPQRLRLPVGKTRVIQNQSGFRTLAFKLERLAVP